MRVYIVDPRARISEYAERGLTSKRILDEYPSKIRRFKDARVVTFVCNHVRIRPSGYWN